MAELKATIIRGKGDQPDRYFDKNGNELHAGDMIKFSESDAKAQKLYLTDDGQLGTDATNPSWIESGRAVECEYGIYPLEWSDMEYLIKV